MNVFVCMVPLHYYFFKNIYKHIKNAQFVIPPLCDRAFSSEYGGGMSGAGQPSYIKKFLQNKEVSIADYGKVTKDNFINYMNNDVKNIICPHAFLGMDELYDKRLIKMVYGIPSDTRSLKYEYIYLMDLILTFGTESAERISKKMIKAVPVGNPLFDDWFEDNIDQKEIDKMKTKIDKNKKVLLYLPTWGEDSSLDKFFDGICGLTDEYNVIVKLHHGTFYGEINRLCTCLSNTDVIVVSDFYNVLALYKLSDIVVTDGMSGATFDALLIDKPVLTIGSSLENYGLETFNNRNASVLKSIPFIGEPEKLKSGIKEVLNNHLMLDNELKHSLYYLQDGLSGKRAAEAILDEIKYPMTRMLDKYTLGITNAEQGRPKEVIAGSRNIFLNRYFPEKQSKNMFSKIKRLLKH